MLETKQDLAAINFPLSAYGKSSQTLNDLPTLDWVQALGLTTLTLYARCLFEMIE